MPTKLKMGTFCSGIGAPEVAGRDLFEPIWFSEIEPFPCAVLAHHWPDTPNLGDMTVPDLVDRIAAVGLPDVVVAGLPCQPFSVAGLRKGENDPRNLTARFVEIADALDDLRRDDGQPPVWWLVENVPGLLSDRGNAFGALLGGMVGSASAIIPDGRWESAGVATGPRRSAAWRVLDAQFFGVAQRRKRVFALFVGGSARWRCADALLPIIDSMSWHSPPRREAGQGAAPTLSARIKGGGGLGTDFDCDGGLIASTDGTHPTLRSMGHSSSHQNAGGHAAVAFQERGRSDGRSLEWQNEVAYALTSPNGGGRAQERNIATPWAVRRLTPTETLRLQGFSDTHTAITYRGKPAADGPQYRAHGNSMAVPVIRWIMERMRLSMEGMA